MSGDPLSLLYEALSAKSHEEGVFVEANVVRNDNGDPLDRAIDGQATARLERVSPPPARVDQQATNLTPIAPLFAERVELGGVHGDLQEAQAPHHLAAAFWIQVQPVLPPQVQLVGSWVAGRHGRDLEPH